MFILISYNRSHDRPVTKNVAIPSKRLTDTKSIYVTSYKKCILPVKFCVIASDKSLDLYVPKIFKKLEGILQFTWKLDRHQCTLQCNLNMKFNLIVWIYSWNKVVTKVLIHKNIHTGIQIFIFQSIIVKLRSGHLKNIVYICILCKFVKKQEIKNFYEHITWILFVCKKVIKPLVKFH